MKSFAKHWQLDPAIDYLNHGSFGACPTAVLEVQAALRARMERELVDFYVRRLEGEIDAARERLARLVGADPAGLVFVPNATFAVNSVVASLELEPGDELLTTDHDYNACRNALAYWAERRDARVTVAAVPFPLDSPDQVIEAVLARVTPRTKLALLDHVTSPTALVFPIERLVTELDARGVDVLVDGAHAVGMLPLDLDALGAAYYTSNCHKWLCAPKTTAFLHVRDDRRGRIRPVVISHGANDHRSDRSRFWAEFDWLGTLDPSALLSVPAAASFLEGALPGGLTAVRERNRALALEARDKLCAALGVAPPCPDEMVGAMAAIPLPDGADEPPRSALYIDALQEQLFGRGIEVPVIPWPAVPHRLIRVSAQLYNSADQYDRLAAVITELLGL